MQGLYFGAGPSNPAGYAFLGEKKWEIITAFKFLDMSSNCLQCKE